MDVVTVQLAGLVLFVTENALLVVMVTTVHTDVNVTIVQSVTLLQESVFVPQVGEVLDVNRNV